MKSKKSVEGSVTDPFSLDDIPEKILGPTHKKRLENDGEIDMWSICARDPTEIKEITQMDKDEADALVRYCREHLIACGKIQKDFRSARDIYESRKTIMRISSGSPTFDKFLNGGFESQATTELFGKFSSGKTQACFTATAMALTVPKSSVIFIDTEGTFRPERIVDVLKGRGIIKTDEEAEPYLDRIIVARAHNTGHQIFIVKHGLEETIRELKETNPVTLVVMDSLMALFKAEMIGQSYLARRQQSIGSMYHKLGRLAETYNFAVIVTNHLIAGVGMFEQDHASGGNTVAHTSTYRISMRKNKKGVIVRMVDSPQDPEYECSIDISELGMVENEKREKPKETGDEE
jgi:DNA repair protein RadA